MRPFIIFGIFMLLLTLPMVATAQVPISSQSSATVTPPTFWGGTLPEPTHPDWMQTDTNLQTSVKFQAIGKPLRVALAEVAKTTGVDVTASSTIRECRVSLAVGSVPLSHLMARLQDLFGHGKLPSEGYEWQRTVSDDGKKHYILVRNAKGQREEQAMLDLPQKTAVRWLRQLRDYSQLPPKKRKEFKTDWPDLQYYVDQGLSLSADDGAPQNEAFGILTDDQIDQLVQEGHLTIPISLSLQALNTLREKATPNSSQVTRSAIMASPPPTEVDVAITPAPEADGLFDMHVSFGPEFPGRLDYGGDLDTLHQEPFLTDIDALEKSQKNEKGPVVDLLADKAANNDANMSLPVALDILAREAKISIYGEVFLRRMETLVKTKGKPEYLLSQICRVYDCDWRKVGSDYLVYSRRWAQDRLSDIPQPKLDRWAASRQNNGRYTLSDLLEMASLSDKQLSTLQNITDFPIMPRNRTSLRWIASVSLSQFDLGDDAAGTSLDNRMLPAFRPQGVVIGDLTDSQLAVLPQMLGRSPDQQMGPPLTLKMTNNDLGLLFTFTDAYGSSQEYYQYEDPVSAPPKSFLPPKTP